VLAGTLVSSTMFLSAPTKSHVADAIVGVSIWSTRSMVDYFIRKFDQAGADPINYKDLKYDWDPDIPRWPLHSFVCWCCKVETITGFTCLDGEKIPYLTELNDDLSITCRKCGVKNQIVTPEEFEVTKTIHDLEWVDFKL